MTVNLSTASKKQFLTMAITVEILTEIFNLLDSAVNILGENNRKMSYRSRRK